MSSLIERLLSKAKATTAEAIRAEESKAERALQDAQEALARARITYTAALLDEDPKAAPRTRSVISECEIAVERGEALVSALRERFLQACESESQAEAEQDYQAAKNALAEAEQKISVDYPKLAGGILKLIEFAAEAMLQVERANENLPSGESPIVLPPMFGGQMPSKPEVIRSRQVVEKWTFEATGKIVDAERDVVTTGAGRGVLEGANRNQPVLLRRFEEITFNPVESQSWNAAFFEMLRLPKLDGSEAAVWRGGADTPEALLEDVRQALSNLRNKPAQRPRPVQTRLVPL
jgi:hypothetical protein